MRALLHRTGRGLIASVSLAATALTLAAASAAPALAAPAAMAPVVTATIPVGDDPVGVAVNPLTTPPTSPTALTTRCRSSAGK
jgi:hypothetical protein